MHTFNVSKMRKSLLFVRHIYPRYNITYVLLIYSYTEQLNNYDFSNYTSALTSVDGKTVENFLAALEMIYI